MKAGRNVLSEIPPVNSAEETKALCNDALMEMPDLDDFQLTA